MPKLFAMFAVLALAAAPMFAQEIETLPDGRKLKIVTKGDVTIIKNAKSSESESESVAEADADGDEVKIRIRDWADEDFPAEVREIIKEMRKRMEELRKEHEDLFRRVREKSEERIKKIGRGADDWENDPDAEVEEWEEVSEDGKTVKQVKVVRIRKETENGTTVKESKTVRVTSRGASGDTPEIPKEEPKRETERKQ